MIIRKRRMRSVNTLLKINKEEFIDKRLIDKASLWILCIILKLGGYREFIDKNDDKFTREDVLSFLGKQLEKLEKKKKFANHKLLYKNIAQISSLMKLNSYEEQILEFVILLKQGES